jgi:hypothetical protein
MPTPELQLAIDRLDLAFQKLTDRAFQSSGVVTGREQGWKAFLDAGFTLINLEETILWIKRGIREGHRREGALKWRTLIGDLQTFQDEHSTALAERRNTKPQPSPKDRVVAQARPLACPQCAQVGDASKPASEYVKSALEKLRQAVG